MPETPPSRRPGIPWVRPLAPDPVGLREVACRAALLHKRGMVTLRNVFFLLEGENMRLAHARPTPP
jgi:hypothetical protein